MRKLIYANLSWLAADKLASLVGGAFVTVLVVRYLGPERFGILNYAIAYFAFFAPLSDLGLRTIVIRELSKDQDRSDLVLGSTLFLRFIGALMAVILAVLSITVYKHDPLLTKLVVVLGIANLIKSIDVVNNFFSARYESKFSVIARNVGFVISAGMKIAFVLSEFEIVWFALATMGDAIIVSSMLLYLYRINGNRISNWSFSHGSALALLRDCWPLFIITFISAIHLRFGQIMLEYFLTMREVGLYAVAIRFIDYIYFVPSIVVNSVLPYLVKIREESQVTYRSRLIQLYSAMFWFGVVIAASVSLVGERLIVILLGESYRQAYVPLQISIWSVMFLAQSVARSAWSVTENLQGYRLINNVLFVIVTVVLNLLLIPRYGIVGPAIASVCSMFLATWIFPLFFKPLRQSAIDTIIAVNPKYCFPIVKK